MERNFSAAPQWGQALEGESFVWVFGLAEYPRDCVSIAAPSP
jgi:hypothetical protein